ncbi:hypothetical protein [Phascolarctobacterium succinatutens]|uniref:Uncharacterized protein n=1 Tax=Phascolarctobacterium succinatutens TaxID=626940 RepID=A0A1Q6R545_9FIRM|nr:hypothetical protein [Phascolarctobacterium succinatutens]OLA37479.1 MAG: hypothetical protein BHW43_06535 [Phascolarctobacterium succinatutens]
MNVNEAVFDLLRCARFNHLNGPTQKEIAQAAEKIMGNLEGMSRFEAKKTLKLVKMILDNYLVVSNSEDTRMK